MQYTATHPETVGGVLDETDAARYLDLSVHYLRASRLEHYNRNGMKIPRDRPRTDGPPYVRLGRAVRYLRSDLDAWLLSRRVTRRGGPEAA